MTDLGQLYGETWYAIYCHHTVYLCFSVFEKPFCLILQNCLFSVHSTPLPFISHGWVSGHCENTNNSDQNCCHVSVPGCCSLNNLLETGLQFCAACTDQGVYIWACCMFTSAVKVLVISLVSAKGLKDFQIIKYWQEKLLFWRNMKLHRTWASFKKHRSHKISFHVMSLLLLKVRNLCQKALLDPSNYFQRNRLHSKVENLYVLKNQFFRSVHIPSFASYRGSGSLQYLHCTIQMKFYHWETKYIYNNADLGYQLGLNMRPSFASWNKE